MKPLVLAEPPPEAVVTLSDLEMSASGGGSASGAPAKGDSKFTLNNAALELGANRNSDKRQMLYRLNEAALNFPEVRTNYAKLFIAIVNAESSAVTNAKPASNTLSLVTSLIATLQGVTNLANVTNNILVTHSFLRSNELVFWATNSLPMTGTNQATKQFTNTLSVPRP